MKRTSILIALLFANTACGESRSPFYLKLNTGISEPSYSLKNEDFYPTKKLPRSGFVGGGVGYVFNDKISSDIMLTFRSPHKFSHYHSNSDRTQNTTQNFTSHTALANLYYTVYQHETWKPYISAGVGISKNRSGRYYSYDEFDDSTTIQGHANPKTQLEFAWALGAGMQTQLSKNLSVDCFYKYSSLGKAPSIKISHDQTGEPERNYHIMPGMLNSHEIGLGLVWRF